jgi:Domain of unknown function (DUF4192)
MTPTLALRSPADLLAAIPYLLGFHPSDSVVLLGLRASALIFQMRGDLPDPGEVEEFAGYYARVVHRQRVSAVLLVGYGPDGSVTPVLTATAGALRGRGVAVPEILRADAGRYWSHVCPSAACCPPEGTAYDVSTSLVAAQATLSGCVALPSRADLERRLAPVDGPDRAAMRTATTRAARRLADLIGPRPGRVAALEPAGCAAVDAGIARHRARGRLDHDEVAWLSVVIGHLPVRDHAWRRIDDDLPTHVSLWTDVVRRAEPELAAPAACLLSLAAWRSGEGAVASIALARALAADPGYRMGRLLDHALRNGLSPAEWEAECDGERLRTRSVPA